MSTPPPAHTLRELRREAKRLVKAVLARSPSALERVAAHHPRHSRHSRHSRDSRDSRHSVTSDGARFQLADAQLVLARERAFPSWPALLRDLERRAFLATERAARAVELLDAICGRGWDAPSTANLPRALAFLDADPSLGSHDFVLACVTGALDEVRRRLADDPSLATTPAGPRQWTPLVYVAFSILSRESSERAARLAEVGSLLLASGAPPHASYEAKVHGEAAPHPFPALFGCVHVSDNLLLAERLLEAGATPNDSDTLYHAAERSDTRALDLLARFGLEPGLLSYCLLHKIDFGHLDGVRWFLDHGADPNVAHPNGHRAIHWAIMRPGPDAMTELLLERGADPNLRTRAGHTALDLAERWLGRVDLVGVIEQHGGRRSDRTPMDELIVAAAHGDEARVRMLLGARPDLIDAARRDAHPLVASFAACGSAEGACALVRIGFRSDTPSWMGMTALHWAACRGNPKLAADLLALDVPSLDLPGCRTPLHTALHRRWFGSRPGERDYAGVVRVLIDAGVTVPDDLEPCGDAELDALIEAARG